MDDFSVCHQNQIITPSEKDYSKLPILIDELTSKYNTEQLLIESISFQYPSVFVPKKYFNENAALSYLENYCARPDNFSCSYQLVGSQPLVNVFYYPRLLNEIKKGLKLTNKHYWSSVLNYLLRSQQNFEKDQKLVLFLQEQFFDLFHFQGSKFIRANRFEYENVDEFIYYLFCFMEAYHLKKSDFDLISLGKFNQYTPCYHKLSEYLELKYFDDLNNSNQARDNSHYPRKLFT